MTYLFLFFFFLLFFFFKKKKYVPSLRSALARAGATRHESTDPERRGISAQERNQSAEPEASAQSPRSPRTSRVCAPRSALPARDTWTWPKAFFKIWSMFWKGIWYMCFFLKKSIYQMPCQMPYVDSCTGTCNAVPVLQLYYDV
eukprot:SAG31_NODE_750_length_12362_cov_6.912827_2_plen_144_part_00